MRPGSLLPCGLLLLAACHSATDPHAREPVFEARITEVIPVKGEVGRARVVTLGEDHGRPDGDPVTRIVLVEPQTPIQTVRGQPADLASLTVGRTIQVWASVELRSLPPQYPAEQILVSDP